MNGWLAEAAAGVGVGLLLGAAYFGGLVATTRQLTRGSASPPMLAISLTLRLALLGVVLVLLARWSPTALLASAGALIVARVSMTRAVALDRWFGAAVPAPDSVGSRRG
jgi:F1F0 ATPase subunit 2